MVKEVIIGVELNDEINPHELVEKGWSYWDPPGNFSPEMWDLLLSIIGGDHYKILIKSKGPGWVRGQLLLSPEGIQNLMTYKNNRS